MSPATLFNSPLFGPNTAKTTWWHPLGDGRIQCDVCPRHCRLHEGQRGLCFVRARENNEIVSTTYGRSSGYCLDPIEKKPLNHFLPGTSVLSFGTAGCNLTCRYCQNWDISKSRDIDTLADSAMPETIAETASQVGARSVAFTYNDPVIFGEYMVDTAVACRQKGIATVAVTAGYISAGAREEFFAPIDAANVDLKGFTDEYYHKVVGGKLQPVLDTITWLVNESPTWVELTTLVVPGYNDTDEDLDRMTRWVVSELGPDVPMHFSAFHPDYKMLDVARTPPQALHRARTIARENGVRHAYTGNISDREGDSTYCPSCARPVIVRDWYAIIDYSLDDSGHCTSCGEKIPGVFAGPAGTWGRRRQPVIIGEGIA